MFFRHIAVPMILSCTMMFAGCAKMTAIEPMETSSLRKIDDIIANGIENKVFPGAVVVVGQPNKLLWAKAYGHTTYKPDAPPMTLDSMFDMASISKVMGTTSAALVLMDEGRLSPDDSVSKFIPGFDSNGKEGDTIRDLMTHVSGLKAYESKWAELEKTRPAGESKPDLLIEHYAALPASYPPRSKVIYSCLNFQTTARVTENIMHEPMEQFLKEHVFGPLNMRDTVYTLSPDQVQRAVPTLGDADGNVTLVAKIHDPLANYHGIEDGHCPGNAGLFSSGRDVARFCEMVANGGSLGGKRIFSTKILDQATTTQTPESVDDERGLGWDVYETPPWVTGLNKTPETLIIGHTGYTGTLMMIDKNTRTYLVLLTNRVFPDDKSKGEGKPTITTVRRAVADTVWRSQPVYAQWFREQDEKNATRATGN
ncbi:beta-lactamase family protein [Candidatus Sumerlaeota bacterium]|nr:beta-lactamase family protein [Candidatus Sumerlaeota bacterium]